MEIMKDHDCLENSTDKVCSFDIFDTLLIRACGAPDVVFDILAGRILGNDAPQNKKTAFALERQKALYRAESKYTGKGDPTIIDIYENADFSAFSSLSNREIMETEMDIESDMLTGVRSMRDIVSQKRSEGYQIFFTSDMYLPSAFLRRVLTREGFYKDGDSILVSCEQNASKRNGYLFPLLTEGNVSRVIHYGDNRHSDGKMLRRSIKGRYVNVNHKFTSYQQLIAKQLDICQQQRPYVLASISKAVLLSYRYQSPAVRFAADIVAPTLVPVVYRILKNACEEGVKKLFFFARDGKIMLDIAKIMSPLFPDIELKYIYLSRTSFYIPSLEKVSKENIESLYLPLKDSGSTPEQFVRKYMPGIDFGPEFHFDSFDELFSDNSTVAKIADYHVKQRALLLEYLEDIGFASHSDNIGGVDMNGSGKTFEYLNRFLLQNGFSPIRGFVYNLTHTAATARKGEINSVFAIERNYGHYIRVPALIYIFEDYIAATDDGRTTHYGRDNSGKVMPVLEQESPVIRKTHTAIHTLHKEICAKYALYFMQCQCYSFNDYNVSLGQWLLSKYGRNPLKAYVKPLTDTSYDLSGLKEQTIVKKLRPKDLANLIRTRGNYGSWARGSVVATFGNPGRFAIWILGKLKYWYQHR